MGVTRVRSRESLPARAFSIDCDTTLADGRADHRGSAGAGIVAKCAEIGGADLIVICAPASRGTSAWRQR